MFVIDASAMLSWCFDDEKPRNAETVLRRLAKGGMAAPAHFPLECVNIIRVGERERRLTVQQASAFIALVESLRIEIDAETARRAWSETAELSRRTGLTAYDAAYLELAIRRQATLVSRDKQLIKAAEANKTPVFRLARAS
ncbi:MAG: type II toxin-antitoxin system VapC family toxin [Hyphomonadaceae bacterium]